MTTGCSRVEIPYPLGDIPGITARFIGRVPGIDTTCERSEAMRRLRPAQEARLSDEGLATFPLVTAEQIHGNAIAVVTDAPAAPIPSTDGLATTRRGITLGIFVADCAPVWLVARDGSTGALLHSGKKGTELGIMRHGITLLREEFGIAAQNLIAVIGPCIRPPCYEVDFAAEIRRQSEGEGVELFDGGICTACHPDLYYSYRREKGLTGRMLATLTLLP